MRDANTKLKVSLEALPLSTMVQSRKQFQLIQFQERQGKAVSNCNPNAEAYLTRPQEEKSISQPVHDCHLTLWLRFAKQCQMNSATFAHWSTIRRYIAVKQQICMQKSQLNWMPQTQICSVGVGNLHSQTGTFLATAFHGTCVQQNRKWLWIGRPVWHWTHENSNKSRFSLTSTAFLSIKDGKSATRLRV